MYSACIYDAIFFGDGGTDEQGDSRSRIYKHPHTKNISISVRSRSFLASNQTAIGDIIPCENVRWVRSGFWRWESWQTGADGNEATQLPNRPPSASDSVGNVSTG